MNLKIIGILSLCLISTHANFRIGGGSKVDIKDYPYQISLLYNGYHICGGTILGPHTVLTAAHCTDIKPARNFHIRYNSNYINTGGIVISVKKIHQHPKYVPLNIRIDYDVSVLILKSPIRDASARMAKLPNYPLKVGTLCNVTGWGATSEEGPASYHLQKVELPIVSFNYCNKVYSGRLTDRSLCAGFEKGGYFSCFGDSGGPLTVDNTVYGIVSWGRGCGRPNYPGVYTNVLAVKDFINYYMEKTSNSIWDNIIFWLYN